MDRQRGLETIIRRRSPWRPHARPGPLADRPRRRRGGAGAARGAGAELALACDVRIADESAIFSHPEVDLGWMPSHGATARLSKIVGRSRALEILVSGKEVKALDALRLGIVNHLASPGG